MARPSRWNDLPGDVRAEIERLLVARGFSDYAGLVQQIDTELGVQIPKSTLHREGQKLERTLNRIRVGTEAARQIVAVLPDAADDRTGAVVALVQSQLFGALLALEDAESSQDPSEKLKLLTTAARAVSEIGRASVQQKRWQEEVKDKVNQAANKIDSLARQGGLSAELVLDIRREVLGISV